MHFGDYFYLTCKVYNTSEQQEVLINISSRSSWLAVFDCFRYGSVRGKEGTIKKMCHI